MERQAAASGVRRTEEERGATRLLGVFGLDWPRLTRVGVGIGLALAFALAGAFNVIPIAVVGWLLGPRAGGLAALLFAGINFLAQNLAGTPGWAAPLRSGIAPGIPVTIVIPLLVGLATGGLRHLVLRMQRQGVALTQQGVALGAARAEARAVLDATAEAMVLVDADRCFRLVNQAFSELLGVAPDAVLGRDFRELGALVTRVFADPDGFGRLVAGTAADPTRRFSADVRQCWPQERDLMLTTAPVSGPDGHGLGRLYVLRDVTQEREVARLREERQRALETEVARAAQLQADLLPTGAPVLAGFDFAARCLPAKSEGTSSTGTSPLPGCSPSPWGTSWARACRPLC